MRNLLKFTLASASLLLTAAASASTINLSGVVRDLSSSHPDFEHWCCGSETGLVKDTLGVDGTPVFDGGTALTTAENFADWYSTGTNHYGEQTLWLTLDNSASSDPDVYSYSSSSFFPIDNQLGGNEGNSHNYHFTFRLNTEFTYTGGEVFTFTGDDDVWVYINNKLVIDLGGVHGAQSQSVSLDSLGLTAGNDYGFSLFFAERHTVDSNFRIDTSIKLKPTEVPEPSTLLLFGLGLAGLGLARRKSNV